MLVVVAWLIQCDKLAPFAMIALFLINKRLHPNAITVPYALQATAQNLRDKRLFMLICDNHTCLNFMY
jgi:hypothetical protein